MLVLLNTQFQHISVIYLDVVACNVCHILFLVCVANPIAGCLKYDPDDATKCLLCKEGKYPTSENTACESLYIYLLYSTIQDTLAMKAGISSNLLF